MARRSTNPSKLTIRPPEPLRPEPSQIAALSLLSTRVRRRRHNADMKPRDDS